MPDKIFLHILILCGIWSQTITGTFADEETKESSDFLVRQKRVVSHAPDEDISVSINDAPYLVVIRSPEKTNCLGNILSFYVVITTASCVPFGAPLYKVTSSSSRPTRGNFHDVLEIRRHFGDELAENRNGVGLLTINPPFVYSHKCQPIQLHSAPLLPGIIGKVTGSGYIPNTRRGVGRGTENPYNLRTIEVPIISHQNCVNIYRPYLEISTKEICTYHPHRHCGHSDGGAGLVVDGYLAGIFLQSGIIEGQIDPRYPDVFVILQDVHYNQWIRTNVQNIELHFQHQLHYPVAQHAL